VRFVDGVTCDSGPYFLLADVIHLPCSGCLAAFRCPVRSTEKITVAYLRWLVFTDFLAARTMGSVAWLCCMLRQTHQDGARADYSTEASSPTVIDLSPSGHRCLDVSRCLPRGQRPPRPGSAQRLPAVPRPLTASSYRVECDLSATAGRLASCCLRFAPGCGRRSDSWRNRAVLPEPDTSGDTCVERLLKDNNWSTYNVSSDWENGTRNLGWRSRDASVAAYWP